MTLPEDNQEAAAAKDEEQITNPETQNKSGEGEDMGDHDDSKTSEQNPDVTEKAKGEPSSMVLMSEEEDVELRQLRGLLKYYQDGIDFISEVEKSIPVLLQLLASSGKIEVVEAMRFFVVTHRLGMECASEGVRKMVHKIWDKSVSENEAKSIRDYLVDCYQDLYMEPIQFSRPAVDVIADNLIQ